MQMMLKTVILCKAAEALDTRGILPPDLPRDRRTDPPRITRPQVLLQILLRQNLRHLVAQQVVPPTADTAATGRHLGVRHAADLLTRCSPPPDRLWPAPLNLLSTRQTLDPLRQIQTEILDPLWRPVLLLILRPGLEYTWHCSAENIQGWNSKMDFVCVC
jgi:hypothetical protein